jgi:hypothetical protein
MNITDEQRACQHEFNWAPDGLDGMCKHCSLYVMKPSCVAETNKWFCETFGVTDEQMHEMGNR